jgi:pyochelin biosynthetic protein PchC
VDALRDAVPQDRRIEPPIDNIPESVGRIAEMLLPGAARSRVFFAHSMGAVFAFEVGRLLAATMDRPPAGVIASGRRVPSVSRQETLHLKGDAAMVEELTALGGTHAEFLRDPAPAAR